jgi:hypothetical protein
MITIEIMGGLGNQLFQIFHLISYGLIHKVPFFFEYKNAPDRLDRPFYWNNFLSSLKPFVKEKYQSNIPIYREIGFHYTEPKSYTQIDKPFKFFGYFQSYKYFHKNEKDILKFIKLNKQMDSVKTKYNLLCDYDNTVSIHFRIGDYKHQQQNHPVMSVEYYESALQHIINHTGRNNWNILYFYEKQDTDMVKEKITMLQEKFPMLIFTPINTEIIDFEQLLLMSLCRHNVIANSSFSWWGAYFNQNQNKMVTYPSTWFGPSLGNKRMEDMFPVGWIKIDLNKAVSNQLIHNASIKNYSVLIIDSPIHHKNKMGIERVLTMLEWKYKYGTVYDIPEFDLIFSPCSPIDSSKYPNKKFIYGPHFSVFPTGQITRINNVHNNSIYIQPSEWATDTWKNMGAEQFIPVKTQFFPVDTDRFSDTNKQRIKVFIYFKLRNPAELYFVEEYLKNSNIEYKIFDYVKKYNEEEYLKYLQESKYGIILGRHESQGFAIEEALSCNVPLLVWNTRYMSQEYGYNYKDIDCTTIPYWDDRCGEFFYDKEEFGNIFDKFIYKLETYRPRQYVLEHLSVANCGKHFIQLLDKM